MREKLILDETWELAGFDPGEGDWGYVENPYPIPAQVPGDVHTALMAAEMIGDPLGDAGIEDYWWVNDKEWWYRKTFELPEDFIRSQTYLEFEGLDTFATVLVNGRVVGTSRNMFIPQRFNISDMLDEESENIVEVRFSPASVMFAHSGVCDCVECNHAPEVSPRKMRTQDRYPRLISTGIWRSARIVSYDRLSIRDIQIQTEIDPHESEAWITVDVENHINEEMEAMISVVVTRGDSREMMDIREIIPAAGGKVEAVVRIEEPEFWWPNGMGEQPMYTAMVALQTDRELLDVRDQHFALRTVRMLERNEDTGAAVSFLINGIEVESKGALWTPASPFLWEIPAERFKDLIALARATDFNTLRVWGGGIYEGPAFYRLCDDLGIMVWQDFMFSQTEYSETDGFASEVQQEIGEVVRRLRNNPSVVLWCGNSNCESDADLPGKRLFTELIPKLLENLDDSRPYLPFVPCKSRFGSLPDFDRLRQ